MKIDITRHTHLTILFILFLSICRTTLAQEANSDSIVISYLQESGIPITQNNRLKLLKSGHTKFIDLFEEIRKAKHHIHLEYFNFRNDSIANALFDLLGEKVKEGVEVRAIWQPLKQQASEKRASESHTQKRN